MKQTGALQLLDSLGALPPAERRRAGASSAAARVGDAVAVGPGRGGRPDPESVSFDLPVSDGAAALELLDDLREVLLDGIR
jgi:hypothetical protein